MPAYEEWKTITCSMPVPAPVPRSFHMNLLTGLRHWAYLEDIYLILREGCTIDDVISFLQRPDTIAKFGVEVDPRKCWYRAREGHAALGAWVGGPTDGTRPLQP